MNEEPLFPSMEKSVEELQSKQRRIRRFTIDDTLIVKQACAIAHDAPGFQIRGLPKDVEVIGVYYRHEWRGFEFLACSMEWDVVDNGGRVPEHDIEIVSAPSDNTEYVRWERVCKKIADNRQGIVKGENALKAVVEGVDEADKS